jgi:formylglycine-generating enzyme required for sulfatase activity
VADEFAIAATEVTIGQYTEFLNAVAATDTHGLYHGSMRTDGFIGNIIRTGSPGSRTYAVEAGDDPNLPVTFVDWYDTARFANWMHNGQPTGSQDASTTEDGAYTFTGTTMVGARNGGAQFFLPTENEWYKAAYHQPVSQGGDSDDYWLYATQTNSVPFSDNPLSLNTPDDTRATNFRKDDGIANGYNDGFAVSGNDTVTSGQLYLTPVGAYGDATSFYGAFDMDGNVLEWTETGDFPDQRTARGGYWGSREIQMGSSRRVETFAMNEATSAGFRLAAAIPEPSRALLSLLALAVVGLGRRR